MDQNERLETPKIEIEYLNGDSVEKPSGFKTDRSKFDFVTSSDSSSYYQAKSSQMGSGLMNRDKQYKNYMDGLLGKSKTSSVKMSSE